VAICLFQQRLEHASNSSAFSPPGSGPLAFGKKASRDMALGKGLHKLHWTTGSRRRISNSGSVGSSCPLPLSPARPQIPLCHSPPTRPPISKYSVISDHQRYNHDQSNIFTEILIIFHSHVSVQLAEGNPLQQITLMMRE
jgi:hypothetical protein